MTKLYKFCLTVFSETRNSLLPVKWQERTQGEVLSLNSEEIDRLVRLVERAKFNWLGPREADFFGVCRYDGVDSKQKSRVTGTWSNGKVEGMIAMAPWVLEETGCPSHIGFSILTSVRQFPIGQVNEAMRDFEVQVAPEKPPVIEMLANEWSGVVGPMANTLDSLMNRRVAASMAAVGCDVSTLRMHFMEIAPAEPVEQIEFERAMEPCWERRGWRSERPARPEVPVLRANGNHRLQLGG